MLQALCILGSGLLFGAGLVVSGLADPQRVLAFLRLGPGWDPALAVTMAAALAVTAPGFAWLRRRPTTAAPSARPRTDIDRRLLLGAGVFGLGWGWAGYCPGPALVGIGLAQWSALVFAASMLAGGWLTWRFAR